ncbi:MAG: hypothetical protein FWE34_09115 [Defluviitaleaceae bacterium]|nr:hypothetical protein [Defluviitaleaceae bacterium]
MKQTVSDVLNYLEKPENEGQIQNLARLKELDKVDEVRNIRGIGGAIARLALRFTQKHVDGFRVLSECKTTADIADFKRTEHYETIKNSEIGDDWIKL